MNSSMFVALYKMVANDGRKADFEAAWAEVTDAIYRRRGRLGSRLHRGQEPRSYVAYAQWPKRERYFEEGAEIPPQERNARTRMRDALESVSTIDLLEAVDDRLRSVAAEGKHQS